MHSLPLTADPLGRRNKLDKSEDLPLQTDFRPRRITGHEIETDVFRCKHTRFIAEQDSLWGKWCTTCRKMEEKGRKKEGFDSRYRSLKGLW